MHHLRYVSSLVLMLLAWVGSTGCVTDATTELTKAPFDATSDISGGVSGATSEFTEPTKEITSSTTPGALFTADGLVKAEQKARAFSVYSFYSLKSDVAQGRGEYLTSFATLLGVPEDQRFAFYQHMQERYAGLYAEGITPLESLNRVMDEARSTMIELQSSHRT
jgi:DUF3015 family protein